MPESRRLLNKCKNHAFFERRSEESRNAALNLFEATALPRAINLSTHFIRLPDDVWGSLR